jgi:hypothetical protein
MFVDETREMEIQEDTSVKSDTDNFVAQIIDRSPPLRSWEDQLGTFRVCLDCERAAVTGEKISYRKV